MIRWLMVSMAFLLVSLLVLTTGAAGESYQDAQAIPATQTPAPDPVVVRVLGESITEKQVLDTINQLFFQSASSQTPTQQQFKQKDTLYYKDALDTLIGTILLKNEAKEKHLVADQTKVEENLRSMKGRFPDEAQFQKALQSQGIKEQDLRNSIETNLLCQQLLDDIAKALPAPTDADIRKVYEENPKSFEEPEKMHAAAIYLKFGEKSTPEQRDQLRKKLEAIRADIEGKKTTFAEAAIKESQDKSTGPKGGDLGFFKRGDIMKPLADAAFNTKPGSLTPVIEAENGYYLMDVLEIKPAGRMSLEAAQPQIRDILMRKLKREATVKHLDELKAKTKIEVVMSDEEWNKRHAAK